MSLSLSHDVGRSTLATSAERTAVVSRNVAGVGDPTATRKEALVTTSLGGGVRVNGIGRVANAALFENLIESVSALGRKAVEKEGLEQIEAALGGAELGQSPTVLLGALRDELQGFASSPNNAIRGQSVIQSAADLANQLNTLAATVAGVRKEADEGLATSVANINTVLAKFEVVNNSIIKGTHFGEDITDLLDQRDALLNELAGEVEIRSVTRSNNDMVVFAAGGVTLFERVPRSVEVLPSSVLPAGVAGNPVFVDGIPVTGSNPMAASEGRLAGFAHIRDELAPNYMRQLDEIARAVISLFQETDQSATPSQPARPGLFTFAGATGVPAPGVVVDGLAGRIEVNANVDPARGGDVFRLRDGQIADPLDPAYLYNATGEEGFTGRINQLIGQFETAAAFDPAAGLATSSGLLKYAADSEGWFQGVRASVTRDHDNRVVLVDRSAEALSVIVGINLDEEMTELLDLERSYQAGSRLLQVVDEMYKAILSVAR